MDPITLAIVTAVAAGVAAGTGQVAEKVVVDAYEGLKRLIKNKFGDDSKVVKAISELEDEPDFEPSRLALQKRIETAEAAKDPEIVAVAQALLDAINAQPGGQQAIQHIQNVYGDYSAAAGPYGTATVNVNQPKDKDS